jgi:drug/metabolite transporter (DMT)-like permease
MELTPAQRRLHELGPGIVAATSFGISDVFAKVAFIEGCDVLTLSTFRGVFSVVVMAIWLLWQPAKTTLDRRQLCISLFIGVLFAAVVFGLFKAIELVAVPVAILTYFVYPLLTGIVGALIGVDKLGWRGAAAALAAFLGLGLMLGAHSGAVALAGIACAIGAACCRTGVLLITRSALQGADARLITWYSMLSSTAILLAFTVATWSWRWPQTSYGWVALTIVGITVTIAVLAMFMSTQRVGPFRTALIMNWEPLLATLLAAPLLGEVITPLQALGGGIMLAALVAFQLRR